MEKHSKNYLNLKEASDFTGLKESNLRKQIFNREIDYLKVNRLIFFTEKMLKDFMERSMQKSRGRDER